MTSSSADRREYLTATVIDQDFLDRTSDNLANQLEMVLEIDLPSGGPFLTDKLYLSDRNKFVGEHFYEARVNFPPISRTIGAILSPIVEFSVLKIEINNADGLYNSILPGGASYNGFINQRAIVRLGLRDVDSTYITIFDGRVSEVGGFSRSIKSFTLTLRDKFNDLSVKFPTTTFTRTAHPNISDSVAGKIIPYILGDFTVNVNTGSGASVPVFPVNGASASVLAGNTNLDLIISENANTSFVTTAVILRRGDEYFAFNSADITNVNVDNNRFEIKQSGTGGVTTINGAAFVFVDSDKILVQVQGKDLGSGGIYDENAVEQARDILLTYGGAVVGDFDASWDTFRAKNSPAVSAILNIKSRVWAQSQKPALQVALSLLEQVRLEAFIDRNQKLKISALHWDEFDDSPTFIVRNWDVERNTWQPKIDDRNNFNRTKGFFNWLPDLQDNFQETNFFRNAASITQVGRVIEKGMVFPNLHVQSDVDNQVQELLKITSGFLEMPTSNQTWRSLLLDIGDFVTVDIQIGSTIFEGVPCMIRDIGYQAKGLKITIRYWSFQGMPYGTWAGQGGGIVAGDTAAITEDT